jgi:hypothetical protein
LDLTRDKIRNPSQIEDDSISWENPQFLCGSTSAWQRRYVGGAGTGVSIASFSRRPAPESRSDRGLGADVFSAHGQKTFQHMEMLISAAMI